MKPAWTRAPQRVLVAALCVKRHGRRGAAIEAEFQGVEVPDAYVFGFGMDYHEQGRNLPDIHTLEVVMRVSATRPTWPSSVALACTTGRAWSSSRRHHRPIRPGAGLGYDPCRPLAGKRLAFLARHGADHSIAPHQVNYRANLWALRDLGAQRVLGINAVGGITEPTHRPRLHRRTRLIDYTWVRDIHLS